MYLVIDLDYAEVVFETENEDEAERERQKLLKEHSWKDEDRYVVVFRSGASKQGDGSPLPSVRLRRGAKSRLNGS